MSPSIMQDDVDVDTDFLTTRCELRMSDCVKRSESGLTPSEQRGRHLAAIAAHADTDIHPAIKEPQYGPWLCAASICVSVVTVLLSLLVVAQVYLLPDATVWPLGVAALICAAAAAVLGWVGVRGRS